jgi:hypothetical protein
MAPPSKRKRLWVDRSFQLRLLGRMGLYLLLYLLIVWHVGFALGVMLRFSLNDLPQGIGALYRDYFARQQPVLFALVLITPPLLYDLLKFSHRIAGPLYRCRHVLQEMALGKPVRAFTPRKHDLLGELFQSFNQFIKEWNARVDPCGIVRRDEASPAEKDPEVLPPQGGHAAEESLLAAAEPRD